MLLPFLLLLSIVLLRSISAFMDLFSALYKKCIFSLVFLREVTGSMDDCPMYLGFFVLLHCLGDLFVELRVATTIWLYYACLGGVTGSA